MPAGQAHQVHCRFYHRRVIIRVSDALERGELSWPELVAQARPLEPPHPQEPVAGDRPFGRGVLDAGRDDGPDGGIVIPDSDEAAPPPPPSRRDDGPGLDL